MEKVFFSLVLGSRNRPYEVKQCLKSILVQTYNNYEVIIIDQSDNDETKDVIEKYKEHLSIKYFHINQKGLSTARNFALNYVEGRYVCLLDDDAYYDKDYLENAYSHIYNKTMILCGNIYDNRNMLRTKIKCKSESKKISLSEIVRKCPSPTLIIPSKLFEQGIIFDRRLGVGSEFGACEETDLLLQAYDKGYEVYYIKKMQIIHPIFEHTFECENNTNFLRIYNYARGFGALVKKDIHHRHKLRLLSIVILKCCKFVAFYLIKEKRIEVKMEFKGIYEGFRCY